MGCQKKLEALKERNHDLKHNTQKLKQENLKLVTEIDKEKEGFYVKGNAITNLGITNIIFEKTCNVILNDLKLFEVIFGYTVN